MFIIHQIFSLARDWSERVTWANIPQLKLGNIRGYSQFLKLMDNKHNGLNLAARICSDICPWTLSAPRSCWLLGTDNVRGQISEHIFAPSECYCLYILSAKFQKRCVMLFTNRAYTKHQDIHDQESFGKSGFLYSALRVQSNFSWSWPLILKSLVY